MLYRWPATKCETYRAVHPASPVLHHQHGCISPSSLPSQPRLHQPRPPCIPARLPIHTHTHTDAHVQMPMHIYKLMQMPVYMHIYPYICTCSYIQPAVSAPHNRMYQAATGCISTATTGCISPPPQNVSAQHRLYQPPSCMHSKVFMQPAYMNEYAQDDTHTNAHTRTHVYIHMHIIMSV